MLKRKNDRQPSQRLEEERYPNDYWLDEEDGGEDIPEPADSSKPVSGRLHSEPMVTGYEALERQRGVRRPNRKLTRREKKALKRAQKYEAKLHKEHEKADKKNAKKEAKLAAKAEKQAMREAKKSAKKKKSSSATAPPRQQTEGKKVSGGKGSTTEKKVANAAKDKRITAQQSIPYHEMGRDGICRVQDKFYSKTIRFYDINYQLAQNEDKNAIFENWCDFLNYFDSTIHFQLSFINQHSNMAEYEKVIHINPQEDEFDDLRMEFAQMLNNQLAKGNNGLMRTKYITFGIEAENLRKKKMVRDYASKERRKEKEASEESKTAKREAARYRETSEVAEESLDGFSEEIKGKSKRERVLKEQRKKSSRLSFGDESDGMVHGAGIGIRSSASAVKDAAATAAHWKTHEAEDDNAAVEGAHRAELAGENLARKSIYTRERLKQRREQSKRLKESVLDEAEKSRLMFESVYGNEAKNMVKKEAEQKRKSALQKLFQKKRYQKQYQAAKQSKKAKDAAITSAQKFTEKAKDAVKMIVAQNRGIFATVAIFGLIFVLIAASFTSCSASLQGASSAIISTSYSSTDEDIYAAENAYRALEEALNTQINQMESTHPDYDEYRYQIDEIGHNPYQLLSYLTVKYGGFTYDEVAEEIESIFRQQYGITTDSTRETVTETKTVRVGESLGQVVTSGYCNCSICCGQWSGGPTASGAMPTANHTIAVDASNPFVPMGTHVIMNGVEYVVEDTGAFARYGVQFDVYYDNHAAASAHGHQTWEAYIADSNGSQEVQVTTTKEVNRLDVTMTNRNLDTVLRSRMTEEEQERYDAYNKYYGNRDYLFDLNSIPTGSGGFGYTIPADALSDPQFAKMIREAEKYLGVPYVWGGYSPSGFDCSGFVSWVINNCGNGWNIGRCTADGLRSHCSQVSPSEAKPGDLIFFQGTYNTSGASHVGIYVGNNMMIHCGKPVQYTSIASAYWQEHFMAFGRLH